MKKATSLFILVFLATIATHAQLDFSRTQIDVSGNYTMYKGELQKNTTGAKLRVGVPYDDNVVFALSYTHGFPIKEESQAILSGGSFIPSEISLNFSTISFETDYIFGDGETDEGVSFYASLRLGLVLATVKEKLKGSVPPGEEPVNQIEKQKENGFTIGGGLGTQYAFSRFRVFGDAGLAFPANRVGYTYVYNAIPMHFTFNVGMRFSFGSGDY